MPKSIRYIDLSEHHGHRRDHHFEYGAEFNVRVRRFDLPGFVRDAIDQDATLDAMFDEIWWEEANRAREDLETELSRRYRWIGQTMFVGRGPGWLAIEDTVGHSRNWEPIAHIVQKHIRNFVNTMESPEFWQPYIPYIKDQ